MTHIIRSGEKLLPRFSIWNDYPIICSLFVFPIFLIDHHPASIRLIFSHTGMCLIISVINYTFDFFAWNRHNNISKEASWLSSLVVPVKSYGSGETT